MMKNGEAFSVDQLVAFMEEAPANIFFKDTECRYRLISKVCDLVNGGAENSIIGKTDLDIWDDKAIGRRYYEGDLHILRTGESTECVDEFDGPNGPLFYEIKKRPVARDGKMIGIVGIISEITARVRLERELERQSVTDQLTGLNNRNYLEIHSHDTWPAEDYPISVFMLDCNYLKQTNDRLGHEYGDLLLKRVARIAQREMPEGSTAARMGGDEFLLATGHCDEDEANVLIERIARSLAEESDEVLKLDVAMGFATVYSPDDSFEDACRRADRMMYENKARAHSVTAR